MGDLRGKKLGTIFMTLGVLDADQEAAAVENAQRWNVRFGEACVRLGFLDEDAVVRGLAMQMGAPSVSLAKLTIREEVRCSIDASIAARYQIVPVQILDADKRGRRTLVVAMSTPKGGAEIDEIATATGFRIHPVIASERDIADALLKLYGIHLRAIEPRHRGTVEFDFDLTGNEEPLELAPRTNPRRR